MRLIHTQKEVDEAITRVSLELTPTDMYACVIDGRATVFVSRAWVKGWDSLNSLKVAMLDMYKAGRL